MKRSGDLVGLLLAAVFASTGISEDQKGAKLGVWNQQAESEWWAKNTEPQQWFDLVDGMSITLREAHVRHGLGRMMNNPHWLGWMLHTRWLSLFPKDWQEQDLFESKQARDIFVKLGRTPKIRDAFLAALVPEDDGPKAVTILTGIAKAHPDKIVEFANLAIAYAVVFDQPVPDKWPHPFVDGKKVPVGNTGPVARFAFYLAAQEAGALVFDPAKLGVQDLTFLVDSPLAFTEFQYAQQINIRSPGQLAQLYPRVPYNTARISGKEYMWPDPTYRLFDIGTKGGICMDQAYFVAQTGKAKGIPTLLFTGQGLSGDHGWVGYLGRGGRWEMEVAKYGSQEYPIGQAFDPQTWQRITESELQALQSGAEFDGNFGLGQKLLQWAALNRGGELYHEIIRAARIAMSSDPRPWQLEADWLEESAADPKQRLKFWEEWTRNYSRNPDMEVKGQIQLIALLEEMDRESEAERLRKSVMSGNRSKRFDLGIAIAADPVFRKLRLRDFEGAEEAFERGMRKFRSKAGGHLFYNLIQPYALTCLQEGKVDMAKDAVTYLQRDFQAQSGTMLDQDMAALIERVGR
ncbi:MAG: hypothetical protein P1V20_22360 [Verrucomicrobiales bacterium]|nr:hypothetical protein [Verrucomicrobiales bacterium]